MADTPTLVSLSKAQKLRAELKKLSNETNSVHLFQPVTVVTYQKSNPVTLEQFQAQIDRNIQETKDTVDRYLRLQRDNITLKEAIFAANITSGVSGILSQMTVLGKKRELFEALKTNLSRLNQDSLTVDVKSSHASFSHTSFFSSTNYHIDSSVRLPVYTREEIENTLLEISRQLSDLEDEKSRLNNATRVPLNLAPETLKELGLQ